MTIVDASMERPASDMATGVAAMREAIVKKLRQAMHAAVRKSTEKAISCHSRAALGGGGAPRNGAAAW